MSQSSVALCTLCLNEMQWLPKLYQQHKDWPGLSRWVFVESADSVYAQTNPALASSQGLSVDGTTEFLNELSKSDDRIVHIPYGFCAHPDPAQGKCIARSQYLTSADEVQPKYLIVLDADEFYTYQHQRLIITYADTYTGYNALVLKHRDIWKPPTVPDLQLFSREAVGGFWDIPYCRVWRWFPGMSYYTNHNTPELPSGKLLDIRLKRLDSRSSAPMMIHMGFASEHKYRTAKNNYYIARGEGRVDHRGWYTESRAAWETWTPETVLPRGAKVIPYTGPIPEVFTGAI